MSTQVTLVGRLGAYPDIKFGAQGKAITRLRVVTSGRRMVEGKWEDVDTSWWSVTAFGPLAESAADLSKGQAVIVVGKAKEDTYTDKDGNERRSVAVLADDIGTSIKWASKAERVKPAELAVNDDPWSITDPAHAPF